MKKIIYLIMIVGLFISCGDNSNRVNIKEITYSDGFALHNGEKFTGTVVKLGGRRNREDKVENLLFYKNGVYYGYEEYNVYNDSILNDFKMENGRVYKIPGQLLEKINSDSLIQFYTNGNIRKKSGVIWIDGKWYENGTLQRFDMDGKLSFESIYVKGERISRKDFDKNGKEIKE